MRSKDQAGAGWGRIKKKGFFQWGLLSRGPVVLVCAICIFVFIIQYVFGFGWVTRMGGQEYPLGATSKFLLLMEGKLWTLVTYIFVHGDFYHILFNLILIWFVGRILVQLIGNKHFTGVFLLSGIVGALLHILTTSIDAPLVGASAGGFGILIATAAIIPNQVFNVLLFFFIPIRCRLKYLAAGFVFVEIVFVVIDRVVGQEFYIPMISGVAHAAHLGGGLAGLIYVRAFNVGGVKVSLGFLKKMRKKAEKKVLKRNFKRKGKVVSAKVVTEVDGKVFESDEFTIDIINPLLEKISQNGMSSLTSEEQRILEKYSKEISERSGE
ncbi:MAG: rhomboid family intramembrane serine protease [Verrucomicrobiales bacterium]|nr:rhomboid family intramembrane serine protease [Verrucomicrobiales bacterium]